MDNKLISSRQYGFIKGRSTSDLPTLVNCHAVIPGPFPVPVHSPTYPSLRFIPFTPLLPFCHPIHFPYPFPSLSSACPIPQIQLGSPRECCKKLPQPRSVSGQSPAAKRILVQRKQKNWALACGAELTAL